MAVAVVLKAKQKLGDILGRLRKHGRPRGEIAIVNSLAVSQTISILRSITNFFFIIINKLFASYLYFLIQIRWCIVYSKRNTLFIPVII